MLFFLGKWQVSDRFEERMSLESDDGRLAKP